MKFANLSIEGIKKIAIVDTKKSVFWPVSYCIPGFNGDMIQLIQSLTQSNVDFRPKSEGRALSEAVVLAPIDQALRNIFCVGKNYSEHIVESQKSGVDRHTKDGEGHMHVPEAPIIFTKLASAVIGPGAHIPRHAHVTRQLDYEAELGVVIGKGGRHIKKADAMRHVFGYTIINDVTARDLQKLHQQWFLGKSLDGFCPMGPYLVTADEVDGQNLDIRCWVNGILRQNANTKQLIFDIPTLIETLSAGIALQPGDIIATGTPAGVGVGFTPPKFLHRGDVIRIEIQGVGILENEVGE